MSHNNLSKTVAAIIFSLTIASALPVLAQSKPLRKFQTSVVKTTHTTIPNVTENDARGQGGITLFGGIKRMLGLEVNLQGEVGKKEIVTTKSCQTVDVNHSKKYIEYQKKDGTTFNMYQGQTPKVISETTTPGNCSK